jgi:hypothetical protein
VTVALFSHELQGQEAPNGSFGGDHLGPGQAGLPDHRPQVKPPHQGNEEEQTRAPGLKLPRRQREGSNIRDGSRLGPQEVRALFIEPSRKPGKPFLAEEDGEGVDAQSGPFLGQHAMDVIDGMIALSQGDHAVPNATALGRPSERIREEALPKGGIVAELVAEDPQRRRSISEAPTDLGRGKAFHKVRPEGLVLAMRRIPGREEEGLAPSPYISIFQYLYLHLYNTI